MDTGQESRQLVLIEARSQLQAGLRDSGRVLELGVLIERREMVKVSPSIPG